MKKPLNSIQNTTYSGIQLMNAKENLDNNQPSYQCCAEYIREIILEFGGDPMNIVQFVGNCPVCSRFIGITQTPKEEVNLFLRRFNLDEI